MMNCTLVRKNQIMLLLVILLRHWPSYNVRGLEQLVQPLAPTALQVKQVESQALNEQISIINTSYRFY